jgi:hypothetical protein
MICTYHGFTQPISNLSSHFVVIDAKGGEVIHKDNVIGGANK